MTQHSGGWEILTRLHWHPSLLSVALISTMTKATLSGMGLFYHIAYLSSVLKPGKELEGGTEANNGGILFTGLFPLLDQFAFLYNPGLPA